MDSLIAIELADATRRARRDYAGLARDGYMGNAVAHRAVRLVAEAAATLPFVLYDGDREIARHDALDLLARPNPLQDGASFLETIYGQMLIGGAATLAALAPDGTASELHALRPDRIRLVRDAAGWPVAIDHEVEGGRRRLALGPADSGGALRVTLFNPLDGAAGFAPLAAAANAIDLANAATAWNKALLDNSARPSGALVYAPKHGGNLSEDQFRRLRHELEEGFAGSARAGRPLLLEGGLDWKAMALSPRDMDFVEAKAGAARDIALAVGVPPMLLGIPGDATYANYQEANRALWRLTVLPLAGRLARALSTYLTPGLRLWFDLDQVEGLAAERDALWARVGAAAFLSDDEKRQAVGYGPPPDAGAGRRDRQGARPR